MGSQEEKTNVMRLLDARGIDYEWRTFETDGAPSGVEVAEILGIESERVFKTLVTEGKSGGHFVFMIPVAESLDLKKAAHAVGEKSVAMIKSKELLPLTGYVHGGCSPIGMKKKFPTVIDETAELFDTIYFSAGRIGAQVELAPVDLAKMIDLAHADLGEFKRLGRTVMHGMSRLARALTSRSLHGFIMPRTIFAQK